MQNDYKKGIVSVLVLSLLLPAATSLSFVSEETLPFSVDRSLLKTNPANVIHSTAYVATVDGKKTNMIKYAYMDKSIPAIAPFEGEDIALRTPNSYTKPKGTNTKGEESFETTFFSKPQFAKDITGNWRQIEYATTTQEVFLASGAMPHIKKREFAERFFGVQQVFATESTFYPDANAESTSVDGYVEHSVSTSNWSSVHDSSAGFTSDDSGTTMTVQSLYTQTPLTRIGRVFLLFDTSSIGDTDIIDSATLSLYVTAVTNADNDGEDTIDIITTTPASNTALVTGDYDQVGTTLQATSIDITNLTTSAYNVWTLNATGEGNISKTGVTKFGAREGHDTNDSPIGGNQPNIVTISTADETGTSQDPKLVVTHTAITAPTVTTSAATSITSTTAVLNGNISATGGANATARGFAWGTNSALSGGDTATTTEAGDFGTGTFTNSGLTFSPETTYYFRAYATNSGGTGLGTILNFTTLETPPKIIRLTGNVRLRGVRLR